MSDRAQPMNPENAQITSEAEFAKTQPITALNETEQIADLNDTETIAQEAGITTPDGEALQTKEMLEERDEQRWQLDPDSRTGKNVT